MARTGRRTKMSVNRMAPSAIRRMGRQLWMNVDVVVHDDAHLVSELESPGGHDLLAGSQAAASGKRAARR